MVHTRSDGDSDKQAVKTVDKKPYIDSAMLCALNNFSASLAYVLVTIGISTTSYGEDSRRRVFFLIAVA